MLSPFFGPYCSSYVELPPIRNSYKNEDSSVLIEDLSKMNRYIDSLQFDVPANFEEVEELLKKMNAIYIDFSNLQKKTCHNVTLPEGAVKYSDTKKKVIEKFHEVNALWKKYKQNRTWKESYHDRMCTRKAAKIKKTFKKNIKSLKKLDYGRDRREERAIWYERILYPLTCVWEGSAILANLAFCMAVF